MVWHHLLSLSSYGVKGCTYTIEKRMELTKLHMAALGSNLMNLENDCTFKMHRSSSHDMEDSVSQNSSNQFEFVGGSTFGRSKRPTSFSNEQISKIYNVLHRDEVDDVIGNFFMSNGIPFNVTCYPHYKEMEKKNQQ